MPARTKVREMTEDERAELERRSRSRTLPARDVKRAQVILRKAAGASFEAIAVELGLDYDTTRRWVHRFNADGLGGLVERPGRGRKPTYNPFQQGQVIAVARTAPSALELPFQNWSLDRLRDYLHQQSQIPISRAQLRRILQAEGLKWYQERSYFTERPDPQFAEKRGPS